jgi:hypothetical protein
MSEKKILREWYAVEYKPELLKEARAAGKPYTLSGVIQRAGTKNQNGRVYPKNILNRETENYEKAVRDRRALGELDHPESSTISLSNVSHIITKSWWDGDTVMGNIEVLNTPKGQILQALLDAGITIGISSRGVGSTEKKRMAEGDVDMVGDDFQLICYDIVSEPSTPGAFLFREGKSLDLDPKKTWSKIDRVYRALNEITRK